MTTNPTAFPAISSKQLFIGVDVAKRSHVAGFSAPELLAHYKRFQRCPWISFENSRRGFEQLVEAMRSYADLGNCVVLMERTGHYHLALLQYLQEQGIATYELHAHKRMSKQKTDKIDALNLANVAYSQILLGVQVLDEQSRIQRSVPPSETSAALHSLIRRRYELIHSMTACKNKLTAINDEVFPEFTAVIRDPNGIVALDIHAAFPTPAAIAETNIEDLAALRRGYYPSRAALEELQSLARQSIGTRNPGRVHGLVTEKLQLIEELRLLEKHRDTLDAQIAALVEESREGRILQSIPAIGPIAAATIIASIGSIANFERASRLRGYVGWSPVRDQTGTTRDNVKLTPGGSRPLKQTLYLVALRAIKEDTEFREIYNRLVKAHCAYDERTGRYVGKNKVIGRIAGQIAGVIYSLLKADHDLLSYLADGEEAPPPKLYDRELHHAHRTGHRENRASSD